MNVKKLGIGVLYFIFFISMLYLFTRQAYNMYSGDFGSHLHFVEEIFKGKTYIPHPLWHICVHYMTKVMINQKCAGALVTTLFVMLWMYIAHQIYLYLTNNKKSIFYTYLYLFIIFIIGPAYLPIFTKIIVIGTGSPNMIHNVTLLAVKPFALLSIFFTILSLEKEKISYYIVATLSIIISIFAKPSFIIAFLPALALFILFKKMYSKKNIIFFIILSLCSIAVLGYQYLHTYNDGSSSVIISFLGVWRLASPNIPVAIIFALMFPLVYTILNYKRVFKNNYIVLTWIYTIISILYAAFFAEAGPRFNHGNFFWSYMIGLSLIYVFTIADYFKNIDIIHKGSRIILNIILIWQVLVGLYYFIRVLQGYDPAGVFEVPKFLLSIINI